MWPLEPENSKPNLLICKRPHAAGTDMLDAGLELVLETLDQRNDIKPSQKLFFFFRGCKQSSDGCLCDRFVSENVQNRCMWTTFLLDVIVVVGGTALLFPQHIVICQRITTVLWQHYYNTGRTPRLPETHLLKLHVGPWIENMSTLSASCLEASMIITNSQETKPWTLLALYSYVFISSLPSLALFLLITLSLPFSLWWTADLYILQYYQSNSSGCGWLRKCWHNRYVCVHCGSVLSVLEYYKKN